MGKIIKSLTCAMFAHYSPKATFIKNASFFGFIFLYLLTHIVLLKNN